MSPVWEELEMIKEEIVKRQTSIARLAKVNREIDSAETWGQEDILKNIGKIRKIQVSLRRWEETFDEVKKRCEHLQVVK
jgi:hypothetical protein